MAGRPALALGTYGKIRYAILPDGRVQARALFRDYDSHTRPVTRIGRSKADAQRRLTEAIRDRQRVAGDEIIQSSMRVTALIDQWLDRLDASDRAVNTKQQYRKLIDAYVRDAFGGFRLSEMTVAACDRGLATISSRHGPAVGKSCRAVLSNILALAARHDAIPTNPVRDTEPIRGASKPKKGRPRALTHDEANNLTDRLRTLQRAIDLDIPDLVDFALATGARIGELLACRYGTNRDGQPLLDLDRGTWEIDATVVRVAGGGLTLQPPKSVSGHRTLMLPPYAVLLLRGRAGQPRLRGPDGIVFGSPHRRTMRDPSNAAGDLKECLALLGGYEWVTWHTFRKTVLTWFDEAGATAREAADQAGHAKVTMTQNVYYSRGAAAARAATILER